MPNLLKNGCRERETARPCRIAAQDRKEEEAGEALARYFGMNTTKISD